jgi:hypothetical protein
VYHFRLPDAFRDPVFRPERTCHVVFDREVFQRVRDEDLGQVRGQPIRPVLAGFGEPVTDWLFQSALHAQSESHAFSVQVDATWTRGPGWVFVFALRWVGSSRRLAAPDSIAVCHVGEAGEPVLLSNEESMCLIGCCQHRSRPGTLVPEQIRSTAQRIAQLKLRDIVTAKGTNGRSLLGVQLNLIARVQP